MVSSYQTLGPFAAWHPHWHAIVLGGGFDRCDRSFFVPLGANAGMTELWRHWVIALFLNKGLLNPDFSRKLLHWSHSGFFIDRETQVYDEDTRRSMSQYIVRAPVNSLY